MFREPEREREREFVDVNVPSKRESRFMDVNVLWTTERERRGERESMCVCVHGCQRSVNQKVHGC